MVSNLRDLTRYRKTYSFFRQQPVTATISVSGITVTVELIGTGSGDNMINVETVPLLAALDATTSSSGQLAFVHELRDYFFLERTVTSGSTNSIDRVSATGGGVWYRMGLGGNYWKNQLTWYVDPTSGSDRQLGSSDAPLQTIDELSRRLLSVTKLTDDYVVNLIPRTTAISCSYNVYTELDGGSVTFRCTPTLSAMTNSGGTPALIGTPNGDVNYVAATGPKIFFSTANMTGSVDDGLLYVSSSAGAKHLGWAMAGDAGIVHTTTYTTGNATNAVFNTTLATINAQAIVVRGAGSLTFERCKVAGTGSEGSMLIDVDSAARTTFRQSSLTCDDILFTGGNVVLDGCRVRSTVGNIAISHDARLYVTGSGFITPRQQITFTDSASEIASSVFWDSDLLVRSSRLTLGETSVSGSMLVSSSLEVQSDSRVDARSLLTSRSLSMANPNVVRVTGQNVHVYFDDVSTPKANTVAINNGRNDGPLILSWSQMPYSDMLRSTIIVSGSFMNVMRP